MTETAELATIPVIDQEVAEQKRERWGKLGVDIYKAEMELQVRAQSSLLKLFTPTKIEDVAKAEVILKTVKAEFAAIKESRLGLTRPIDAKITELALPENMGKEPTNVVEQAIIALKRADDERKKQEAKRNDELKACREYLTTLRNNAISRFRSNNTEKVSIAYSYALEKGTVEVNDVPEFIDLAMSRRGPTEFDYEYPKNTFPLVTPDEFLNMCQELLIFDSKIFLAEYENALKEKFSDYAVALNNKATALANAEKEKQSELAKIEAQKTNANVAAKIETAAVTPVVSTITKALKQSYAIDMEENVQSANAIMVAFTANIDKCLPKLNVNKWFSITPAQMGVALSKVKMDDDDFAPAGIKFKQVDKL